MTPSNFQGSAGADSPRSSISAQLLEAYAKGERTFLRWNLAGADLHRVNLQDGNFVGTDFTGANLSGADLSRANLAEARLRSANMRGANLRGANLNGADLTGADTTDALIDHPMQAETKHPLVNVDNVGVTSKPSLIDLAPEFKPEININTGTSSGTPSPQGSSQAPAQEEVKPTTPRPSPVAVQTAARPRPSTTTITAGDVVGLILGLISTGWGLLTTGVVVIVVIVVVVGFIQGLAAGVTLNEHSSCQQFEQANSEAQTRVLQDMMRAHNTPSDELQTTRFSLNLYCNVYGPSAPIDGIYGSGLTDKPQRGLGGSATSERMLRSISRGGLNAYDWGRSFSHNHWISGWPTSPMAADSTV